MEKYIILGHENPDVDSIISGYLFEKILNSNGYHAEFVILDEEISNETLNLCKKFSLDPSKYQRKLQEEDQKFILVDHHSREVSGKIVAVIDHHPSTSLENLECKIPYYKNELLSSTTCFLRYLPDNITSCLEKKDWELAILAAMVDTASFHSTKSVDSDLDWIKSICSKCQIDYEKLYDAGLCLTQCDNLEEVKLNGLKKYTYQGKKIHCSYIQIKDVLKEKTKISTILNSLCNYRNENGLDYFIFIVHDMDKFQSRAYYITDGGISFVDYANYTSRGNKIIPDVYRKIEQENRPNIFIASSSREDISPIYLKCASSISKRLANLGYNLAFGASSSGMMGRCYEEFLQAKSNIYSYTVKKYQSDLKNLESKEQFVLDTTFDRTKELYKSADVILILPGGTGTLAELFGVLEENRSVDDRKKVILYNYQGYYDKILEFFEILISEKFNDSSIYDYFRICNSEEELFHILNCKDSSYTRKLQKNN